MIEFFRLMSNRLVYFDEERDWRLFVLLILTAFILIGMLFSEEENKKTKGGE